MDCADDIQKLIILHWNSRSILSKLSQLNHLISNSNIDIILINETWLDENKSFRLPGFNVVRQDSPRPHGGVAVAINSKYPFNCISSCSTYHFQHILFSVIIGSMTLEILSVYLPPPPNGKFRIQLLNSAFSQISSKDFLIIGDFNAHHTAWGCRDVDRRGNLLYSFADSHNLVCLNDHDQSYTTFTSFGQEGNVLDLAFASQNISSSCTFSVGDDPMSSNHFPVYIEVLLSESNISNSRNSSSISDSPSIHCLSDINFNKVNWSLFVDLCNEKFNNFFLDSDPTVAYNYFFQTLCDILLTFPKKAMGCHTKKRKGLIWWNDLCSQVVQQSKLALDSYKTYPTLENYILYKQFDAKKKRVLSEQKLLSWANLCSSFNRMTSTKIIWDFIRRYKFSKLKTNLSSNFFDETNNIDLFLDKITSSSLTNNDIQFLNVQSLFIKEGSPSALWLSDPFQFHELHTALLHKKNTSPGPDFIPYKVIQSLPNVAKNILLTIFNNLWKKGQVPPDWKLQYVVPILKPHKDANSVDAYRPISLTSCFAKCFETMLKNRLEWFVERNLLIPEFQFGFRKGKSTMFNLACLIGDIKNNFLSSKGTLAVFLDVKGAFDNIDHEYLFKSLSNLGFPGPVLKWLFNFLNGRRLSVKFRNKLYGTRFSYKGTPQGSVLSPLIFILSLVDFMRHVPNTVKYSFYADDLVVYTACDNPVQGQNDMNTCLSIIGNLLKNQLKLEVNTAKSSVMLFARNSTFIPKIFYENTLLPFQNSERYLGLILDSELSWKPHIEGVVKRTELGLNILRSLAGLRWGSDPKVLKTLYITTIRSHFDYGCMYYSDADNHLLRKLDVIQNKALRIISGAMMSSPINSLEVEVGVVPLFIRRSYIIDRFSLQLVSRDNVIVSIYLENFTSPNFNETPLSISSNLSSSIAYLNFQFQDSVFWSHNLPCFSHEFHSLIFHIPVNLTRFRTKFDFYEFLDSKKDFRRIYTDGSKTKHRTSFAFYDANVKIGKVFECLKYFSIFSAEVLALIYALMYIKNSSLNCKKFIILSDSMSALQALSSCKISANFNYLIYVLRGLVYDLLINGINIEFCWVPGHSGILGNEIVDSIAKLTENVEFSDFKVPYTDLYLFLKDIMLQRWMLSLASSRTVKGKWLAEIQPSPSTVAWFEKGDNYLGREFITSICRLRIGHCKFPAHLNRLNLLNNSKCKYCSFEPCTLQHLFFDCQNFNLQRLLFISECKEILKTDDFPFNMQDLLKNVNLYSIIFNFIRYTFGPL